MIVESLYRDIIPPDALYEDVTRLYFPRTESGEREKIVEIQRKMTFAILRSYTETWSSYHRWRNDFPDRKSRSSGGSGDIIDEMFDALKEKAGWDDNTQFEVEWDSGLLLARKKDI